MWGKIIEYTKGWRAEYAYPIDFKICHDLFLDGPSRYGAKKMGRLVENNYGALFTGYTSILRTTYDKSLNEM